MRWSGVIVLLTLAASARAELPGSRPYIANAVDAASFTTGIAPGSLFIVTGHFLIPDGLVVSPLPLSESLNGISLSLIPEGGGTEVKAWIRHTYYGTWDTQIAAVLPSTTAPGRYSLSVVTGDTTVTGGEAIVVERKYRSLTNNQQGYGLAVAQNYVGPGKVDRNMFAAGSLPDGQTKSPASPGQIVMLWGLGLGAIAVPDNDAPGAINLKNEADVKAAVGGIDAPVLYAGRSPQFPGIDQINLIIPPNAPTGCNIALQVLVAGEPSNPVTIAVAPPGMDACEHTSMTRQQLEALDQGGKFLVGEFNLMVYVEPAMFESASGMVQIGFEEIHSSIGCFNYMTATRAGVQNYRSVSPGQCTVVRGQHLGFMRPNTGVFLDVGVDDSADGGMLSISGPSLPDVPLNGDDDWYYRLFSATMEGTGKLLAGNADHRLMPGPHTLRAPGGYHVGPFEVALTLPDFLKWTNRNKAFEVDRSNGLEVHWTGAEPRDHVVIEGGTVREIETGSGMPTGEWSTFICLAPAGATSFTVPASVLKLVPPTTDLVPQGVLALAAFSGDSTPHFDAPLTEGGQLGFGSFGSLMMVMTYPRYR